MINIEVTHSTNPYLLGEHRNYGNVFFIGKSSRYNITDNSIDSFKLSVENDKLYIENLKKNVFYLVNGKKISGKKTLKLDDEVGCDGITIKIKHFEYGHIDPITDVDNLYKKRIEDFPELESILTYIEQEFIHLEKLKYNEK